jgi:hypothetical protein
MTRNISFVDKTVMGITKQHQVPQVLAQGNGERLIAPGAIRLVGDDVCNVGRIEFVLGQIITPKWDIAACILTSPRRPAPKTASDIWRDGGYGHGSIPNTADAQSSMTMATA